jgi:uncharacterized LabA/DUF88 family protein
MVGTVPLQFATVLRTDEKGSDVNLASHLLNDAYCRRYEGAVIVSDDSDLAEPIRMVKEELKLVTGILTSSQRPSRSLLPHATFYKQIREGVLRASQFRAELKDAAGIVRKPKTW